MSGAETPGGRGSGDDLSPPGTGGGRSGRRLLLILLLCGVAVGGRLLRITADLPPSLSSSMGILGDQGHKIHNARNRALYGAWVTDGYNPMYLMPVHTGLTYLSFLAFGFGPVPARVPAVVLSLLAILLFYRLLRSHLRGDGPLVGLYLAVMSFPFTAYGRSELMEGVSISLSFLAVVAHFLGRRARAGYFLAGALLVCAVFAKGTNLHLLGPFAAVWLSRILRREPRWLPDALLFCAGGLAAFGTVLWIFRDGLVGQGGTYGFFAYHAHTEPLLTLSARHAGELFSRHFFALVPFLALAALHSGAAMLCRLRRCREEEAFACAWLWSALVFYMLCRYTPDRYGMILFPPMIWAVACQADRPTGAREAGTVPSRGAAFRVLLFLWVGYGISFLLARHIAAPKIRILFPERAGTVTDTGIGLWIVGCGMLGAWGLGRWIRGSGHADRWRAARRRIAIPCLLVLVTAWDLTPYLRWMRQPRWDFQRAAEACRNLIPAGWISGNGAPNLTLYDTRWRCLRVDAPYEATVSKRTVEPNRLNRNPLSALREKDCRYYIIRIADPAHPAPEEREYPEQAVFEAQYGSVRPLYTFTVAGRHHFCLFEGRW
ncbi:MAG: glycosyltransferase family 39 protein [Planctomycetes bacterium]|nr:glycosyltransferase family 39 protein [Planctomycetota bacterium]